MAIRTQLYFAENFLFRKRKKLKYISHKNTDIRKTQLLDGTHRKFFFECSFTQCQKENQDRIFSLNRGLERQEHSKVTKIVTLCVQNRIVVDFLKSIWEQLLAFSCLLTFRGCKIGQILGFGLAVGFTQEDIIRSQCVCSFSQALIGQECYEGSKPPFLFGFLSCFSQETIQVLCCVLHKPYICFSC